MWEVGFGLILEADLSFSMGAIGNRNLLYNPGLRVLLLKQESALNLQLKREGA